MFYQKEQICNEFTRGNVCANKTFCSCIHLIEVDLNDLVEFVIVDETNNPSTFNFSRHPIHLHGHAFAVLAIKKLEDNVRVSTEFVQDLDRKGLLERNFFNPVIKDTVMVRKFRRKFLKKFYNITISKRFNAADIRSFDS